jgi:hypothetical protein
MDDGLLSCSDSVKCPKDCPICNNCLRSICGDLIPEGGVAARSFGTLPLVAFFSTIICAACCVLARGFGRKGGNDLEEKLMDTDSEATPNEHWMVPVKDGGPSENGDTCKPVWLAPISVSDEDPTQVSGDEEEEEIGNHESKQPSALLVVVPKGCSTTIGAEIARQNQMTGANTRITKTVKVNAPATKRNGSTKTGRNSIFPDLLKDDGTTNIKSLSSLSMKPPLYPTPLSSSSKSSSIGLNHQYGTAAAADTTEHLQQTLTSGLWLVPLANESVASTVSDSADKDSIQDSLPNLDSDDDNDDISDNDDDDDASHYTGEEEDDDVTSDLSGDDDDNDDEDDSTCLDDRERHQHKAKAHSEICNEVGGIIEQDDNEFDDALSFMNDKSTGGGEGGGGIFDENDDEYKGREMSGNDGGDTSDGDDSNEDIEQGECDHYDGGSQAGDCSSSQSSLTDSEVDDVEDDADFILEDPTMAEI